MLATTTTTPLLDRSGASSDVHLVQLWCATKASPRTRTEYAADARLLLVHLEARGSSLRSATVCDLVAFAEGLTGAPATRSRRISSAKSLLSFAHRTGYTSHNVGAVMQASRPPRDLAARIMSEVEVARLLEAARGDTRRPPPRIWRLLRVLYASGARIGEVLSLRWADVHATPDGGAVLSLLGKGAKLRHVRVSPATVEALGPRQPDGDLVFATSTGRRVMHSTVSGELARLVAVALPGRAVSPHWLRHAHASHALDRGAPIHLVSATLGHADMRTTGMYAHAKPGQSSGDFLAV